MSDEQDRTRGSSEQQNDVKQSQRFAIVVGVNDYQGTTLDNLNFCSADAEAFYEALLNYAHYEPDNVVLFSDGQHSAARPPSYSDILSHLRRFSSEATDEDSILFFFAGHGTHDSLDSYLLTKEYRDNVLSDSSIALSKVDEYLRNSKAKFIMRFLDACHSGRLGRRSNSSESQPAGPNIEQLLSVQAEGWATFAACKLDQFAYEPPEIGHGIFSFFLVRGLEGAAARDDKTVTLDSLKIYVMDNVIDLAQKRGVTQTPVFRGEQAGQLVMSYADKPSERTLSAALKKIAEVHIDELAPKGGDVPPLLAELRGVMQTETQAKQYVAASQTEKVEKIVETASQVLEWAQKQAEAANNGLQLPGGFSAELLNVAEAPLNASLSKAFYSSNASDALEWTIETSVVTKYRQERVVPSSRYGLSFAAALSSAQGPQYENVPYKEKVAIKVEQEIQPDSTIILSFVPDGHIIPRCTMTICIVPSTLGCYAYCYFASTRMVKGMEEEWEASSFSRRFFIICRMAQNPFDSFRNELDKTFAEFISFIVEGAKSRQATFETMGVPGDKAKEKSKNGS